MISLTGSPVTEERKQDLLQDATDAEKADLQDYLDACRLLRREGGWGSVTPIFKAGEIVLTHTLIISKPRRKRMAGRPAA